MGALGARTLDEWTYHGSVELLDDPRLATARSCRAFVEVPDDFDDAAPVHGASDPLGALTERDHGVPIGLAVVVTHSQREAGDRGAVAGRAKAGFGARAAPERQPFRSLFGCFGADWSEFECLEGKGTRWPTVRTVEIVAAAAVERIQQHLDRRRQYGFSRWRTLLLWAELRRLSLLMSFAFHRL